MSTAGIDEAKLEAFMGQAVTDMGAVISAPLFVIGEKLGLYKAMAGAGPLTSEEVAAVAAELRREGVLPVTNTDIGELIMTITDELPRNEYVARVRALLAAGGWPLADPHSASEFPDGL